MCIRRIVNGNGVTIVNGKFCNNGNYGDVGSNGINITMVRMLDVIW